MTIENEIRTAVLAERERCARIVEQTDEEGDYSGIDADGGSFWQSYTTLTLESAARRIRDENTKVIES